MENHKEEVYNWKLEDIFQSQKEFESEKEKMLSILKEIETYQGTLCNSAENLYQVYHLYEAALLSFEKLYSYGMFQYHLDMANQEGIKRFKEVENLATIFSTSTAYISPEITYADEKHLLKFLEEKKELKRYERDIKETLEKKKYILSKEEENLLANYSEVLSAPENIFDILTNAEFKFGTLIDEEGREVELTDANYTVYLKSPKKEVRKQAFTLMYKKYGAYNNTIAEMYLANVKTTTITAKLRNYKSSLEKAVIHDDASLKVYDALITAVHKNMNSNHEYIALKKKLISLDDFHMYDLYVNPYEVEKDTISFEEGKKEVLESLQILGTEYTNKLKEAFEKNWIDAYEKPNKRGGAYNSGVYGIHPFVLMSFNHTKRDVSTIAHELGHSMHSYYSNENQTILDANYTIMVAEVASTVNELLLSDYQIKKETDPKKKAALIYEILEMIRATFFRQSMFAEFEKIVHEKIEKEEMLSAENLNDIYYHLNLTYFGDTIMIDKEIQYEWARIPHFYSDFYVYKYATGISAAINIASRILKQEEGFTEKYIHMLKQGRTKKSIDLLKMVDVDLESPETYTSTITFYQEKMRELKELIK